MDNCWIHGIGLGFCKYSQKDASGDCLLLAKETEDKDYYQTRQGNMIIMDRKEFEDE